MKNLKLFCTIYILTVVGFSYAQPTFSTSLEHLEIPNSPAFILMDQTVTDIQTPNNLKAFTSNIVSTFMKDFKIPNNYAVTVSPYFMFAKNKSFSNFNGVEGGNLKNVSSLLYQNLALSLALIRTDTIQNISVGFSTNLLRFSGAFKRQQFNTAKGKLAAINAFVVANYNPVTNTVANEPQYNTMKADYNNSYQYFNDAKSVFTVDIAAGYNHFFDNKDNKSGAFGRLGAWSTFAYNQILNATDSATNGKYYYLSVYVYNRYLNDQMSYDKVAKKYKDQEFYDAGGKVDLQLDNFSLAYEYIKRTNNTEYRSIGSIKYQISEKIAVNGGFGKNFKKEDGNIGFLGINWGLDYKNDVGTN